MCKVTISRCKQQMEQHQLMIGFVSMLRPTVIVPAPTTQLQTNSPQLGNEEGMESDRSMLDHPRQELVQGQEQPQQAHDENDEDDRELPHHRSTDAIRRVPQMFRDERIHQLSKFHRFLLFVKIMIAILKQHDEHAVVRNIMRITMTCHDKYKNSEGVFEDAINTTEEGQVANSSSTNNGNANENSNTQDQDSSKREDFTNYRRERIQEDLTARLRLVVSELYWNLTRDYLGYSCD